MVIKHNYCISLWHCFFFSIFMTADADCMMNMDRKTAVQRRPDIYNLYTKRIMTAMSEGSHPWGASSISNRLFPLVEDAMRHLEIGTASLFDYLIHDGRKTIELEELSTLIPQAWSFNRKYVYAVCHLQFVVFSLLCTVCCVQFVVYSLLCTVCCVQFVVYSLLCTVCCVHFVVYSLLCTVCCVQFVVYSLLCTVCCVQFVVYSLLSTVCCVQFVVYSLLSTVCCVQFVVYSLLCTVCCVQFAKYIILKVILIITKDQKQVVYWSIPNIL